MYAWMRVSVCVSACVFLGWLSILGQICHSSVFDIFCGQKRISFSYRILGQKGSLSNSGLNEPSVSHFEDENSGTVLASRCRRSFSRCSRWLLDGVTTNFPNLWMKYPIF